MRRMSYEHAFIKYTFYNMGRISYKHKYIKYTSAYTILLKHEI